MDGNGRWARQRGLRRTEGHARGEDALFDVIEGAIEMGIPYLSAYAFSTENWKRSPDEVRWLMGFNRDVIHRRRDQLDAMGVRIRWAGRRPKLWKSVIKELESAEKQSTDNTVLTLQFCVNYGGRAEIVDAVRDIARLAAEGKIDPDQLPGTVICYADSTIGLPLLTAYALARHAPRPLKRLYDRRDDLMKRLRESYFSSGRAAAGAKR